jgi:hypothetical protein
MNVFRDYPLTWLFIVATVCVDLVVLFTTDWGSALLEDSGLRFYLYNFGLPAQFSTLAVWGVMGKTHRLSRAAWIALAFGSLLLLTWTVEGPFLSGESMAFNFIQFFTVLGGTAIWRACGLGRPAYVESREPIRFSLVEMFGWTIIVALWAFALRYALGGMIVDKYLIVWIAVASLSPVLLVPILYHQLTTVSRLLWLTSAYLLALLAYVIGQRYMNGPMPLWALSMALTQITYISAWWAVVRMDEAMQERRAVSKNARAKLAVFEPRQSD